MAVNVTERKGKKHHAYICGTPSHLCTGSVINPKKGYRGHQSAEEAKRCKRQYLLRQGYEQIDSRAFRPPDGGPIVIITKKATRTQAGKGERQNVCKITVI